MDEKVGGVFVMVVGRWRRQLRAQRETFLNRDPPFIDRGFRREIGL